MKLCNGCKKNKPVTDYHKNSRKKDGLQTHCKVCKRAQHASYYPTNKFRYDSANSKKRDILRAYVLEYLREKCCLDCGEKDPVVLDFDHVTGEKTANISYMIRGCYGLETVKKEILKCEIRCSNCHRRKTAKELGFYRMGA